MKENDEEFDLGMKDMLGAVRPTPQRDEKAAAAARQYYMQQIDSYLARGRRLVAATATGLPFWKRKNFATFAITTLILIGLLVSGGVGVAAAAQDTLPGDMLYGVKTFGEDFHLAFTADGTSKFDLLGMYVERRYDEVDALQAHQNEVPEQVATRLQEQVNQMLQLAANMNDAEMTRSLNQMREMLQEEYQKANAGSDQAQTGKNTDPIQEHIRKTTRECWEATELGLGDAQQFRFRYMNSYSHNYAGDGQCSGSCTPTGESYGPGPAEGTGTPGEGGYGPGPHAGTATPQATGESYGPGPYAGTATPQATGGSYGPGPHAGTATPQATGGSYGPGPQPTEKPGDSHGPGPSDGSTQEPQQEQHNK